MHYLQAIILKEQRFLREVIESNMEVTLLVQEICWNMELNEGFSGHDEVSFVLIACVQVAKFPVSLEAFVHVWHWGIKTSAYRERNVPQFSGIAHINFPLAAHARRDKLVAGLELFADQGLHLGEAEIVHCFLELLLPPHERLHLLATQ